MMTRLRSAPSSASTRCATSPDSLAACVCTVIGAPLCALVALEGPAWRIAKLRRLGYTETAILNADRLDDAERIYAEGAAKEAPARHIALTPAGRQAARAVRTLLDPIGG